MSVIRLAVIAIGCLIGGPYMLYRSATSANPPTLEQLTKVSGIVQLDTEVRSTRRSRTTYPVLIVSGAATRYKYLDWFPRSEEIPQLVQTGRPVTLWTDADAINYVWQIEQEGKIVIPYDDIRGAIVANNKYNWLFGVGGIVLGLGAAFGLYRQLAPPDDMPRPRPQERGTGSKAGTKKPTRKRKPAEDEEW